ncbi:sugar ABC transporter permease [Paenibacillus sp. Soil766]|uniref:carbohydrate ABC transporter permease n=1 Tax=Paenibacillus sp. Soil766 TaxID=1736404 RepID=UPI00070BA2F0|nr:carbohydrate ABC transporter permease [Paenibacillus sp. Soil766]KRF04172.1 sugar ABC transporter permease [Paenibacillus sp. Soil766]
MRETRSDKLIVGLIYLMLVIVSVVVLYPLLFVAIASISNPEGVLRGEVWLWPKDITFVGYDRLLQNPDMIRGYANTITYTIVGTAINLGMTIAAAYPLSRSDFKGRNLFMAIIVFTMFFSGGMIPTYLLLKNLAMLNTFWVMVIPTAVSVWNILIMRTFFTTGMPNEIQEAAVIDGCSNMQLLLRIVLPLSMPIIAVMILFYSVGHWNAYFNALIYLNDRNMYPLQLFLREILVQGNMQEMVNVSDDSLIRSMMDAESIKYAAVIFANLPVLILYPFLQKYFVKGVMIGAIKG